MERSQCLIAFSRGGNRFWFFPPAGFPKGDVADDGLATGLDIDRSHLHGFFGSILKSIKCLQKLSSNDSALHAVPQIDIAHLKRRLLATSFGDCR